MFREYLNLPRNAVESYRADRWFRTGDVAELTESGRYRILGRMSIDIIKSKGFKLSALENKKKNVFRTSLDSRSVCCCCSGQDVWGNCCGWPLLPYETTRH